MQDYIGSFGKVVSWERDESKLARLLVKAKVTDLQSSPKFIVFSSTIVLEGESWMVQCEIVGDEFIDGGPLNEEPVPAKLNDHAPLDFFGLGQLRLGPFQEPISNNQVDDNN